MRPSTTALLAFALLLPAAISAQGTVSTQGLGYPSGQLSTRALGTGGALGEIDPLSVSNPASMLGLNGSALYFQAEPEYRTLTAPGGSERNTIARYPLVLAVIPLDERLFAGLSVSNFLDRSFATITRGVQVVRDTSLATTNVFASDGAIGDVRLAIAWAPVTWIHVGVAGHLITGENRLTSQQQFDDSTRYARLIDTSTVTYTGKAYSAGVEFIAEGLGSVAGSYRKGGAISLKHGDTTLRNANVPDRIAVSAAYLGIKGTSIAFRTAKDRWTDLRGLVGPATRVSDSWDSSLGADVMGPRIASTVLQLRLGGRWRTLPFSVGPADVREKSLSIGAGTAFARGRAALDVAGIRATRDAGALGSESAWTLSVGVTVRP